MYSHEKTCKFMGDIMFHISSYQNSKFPWFMEQTHIHFYLTFNPMRHEICAFSSDTITLKVDGYGPENLS